MNRGLLRSWKSQHWPLFKTVAPANRVLRAVVDKSQGIEKIRLISLTSICCELLEHIIYSAIFQYLNSINFLTPYQHGFHGLSCNTQLVEFQHCISQAPNPVNTSTSCRRLQMILFSCSRRLYLHIGTATTHLYDILARPPRCLRNT